MDAMIWVVGLAIVGFTFLGGAVTGSLHLYRGMSTSPIPNWARLICLFAAACFGGLAVLVFVKNFK
jgi:hypothetical protein